VFLRSSSSNFAKAGGLTTREARTMTPSSRSEFDFDVVSEASDIPRRRPPMPVPAAPKAQEAPKERVPEATPRAA